MLSELHRADPRPTPAGAGSTMNTGIPGSRRTAYPRWRGEHAEEVASVVTMLGLPPLARGAQPRPRRPPCRPGPTPAGAGSTPLLALWGTVWWAYPRWRGEHGTLRGAPTELLGLPPLARGARQRRCRRSVDPGPTPAGAGSTPSRPAQTAQRRAYPRWRGEHRFRAMWIASGMGLPPLARGARVCIFGERVRDGPTPAGAGSTAGTVTRGRLSAAYPRWRGEHCLPSTASTCARGLPPLARGAQVLLLLRCLQYRPTPAGAGSTRRPSARTRRPAAYPRWRGEHWYVCVPGATFRGLPPLARGAPHCLPGR